MKPALVLISPVMPAPTGSGRQIRAYQWLRQCSREYRVLLLTPGRTAPSSPVARFISGWIRLRPGWHPRALLLRAWAGVPVTWRSRLWPDGPPYPALAALQISASARRLLHQADTVLVFRLYMMPVYARIAPDVPACRLWLDMDDWESRCHRRIAELAQQNGDPRSARRFHALAAAFGRWERRCLPLAERVSVCSADDRDGLSAACGLSRVEVVANRFCGEIRSTAQNDVSGGATLLFVGSMGYPPNADGVAWFWRSIWPEVKARFNGPVTLQVAGAGMPGHLARALAADPSVRIHGYVEDLTDLYRQADLAICPLRAGGGTRIKILEAMAHHRAVVTTTVGMEGLEFDSRHLVIADSAQAFARSVVRLLQDAPLRERLCRAAAIRLKSLYWLPPG